MGTPRLSERTIKYLKERGIKVPKSSDLVRIKLQNQKRKTK